MLPRALRELTQELTRLPGIGPKTAERLALHLLRQPNSAVTRLADTVKELHGNVKICSTCYNLAEKETCDICRSQTRQRGLLCIVEDALDVEAIERTGAYDGLYHVLGGVLSPIEGIGPEELSLNELIQRIADENISELIIALDHKMESDATTRHIVGQIKQFQQSTNQEISITRLARGLPTGGDIEFADAQTLSAALNLRTKV